MRLLNLFLKSKQNLIHMDKYWLSLKNQNHNNSFGRVKSWLYDVENQKSSIKKERKTNKMKNFIIANKYKFATVILAALLIYACNLPVTQEKTVGHVLSWTVNGNDMEVTSKIENLNWIDKKQLKKEITVKDDLNAITYNLILPNSTEEQIIAYKKDLESINGIKSINVLPLQESVTRPVYSEVLHSVFKIDIDATNKSDEEVINDITKQLENAGLENVDVHFERQPEGYRKINISIPETEINMKDKSIDMKIRDGNNEEHLKTENRIKLGFDTERCEGKSDEEIKQMLMEDLKDKNITKDDIQIIREGDQIKVKVQKKTQMKKGNENKELDIELEEFN